MLLSDTRLQLVPLTVGFVDFLTGIRTDWTNYDLFFDFDLATREKELAWIGGASQDPTQANFVIISSESPHEPLGTISLTSIDFRSRHAEYGRVYVVPQQRGSGVGLRASRLMLSYAFRELNLHRVHLKVFTSNEPAVRLYHRLGFEEEGCLRRHVYKDGAYRDVTLMALFAESFASMRA